MSTFPITAADVAPVAAYLADNAAADVLAMVLVANRATCVLEGWKASEMGAEVTAADIRVAAFKLGHPTRTVAAKALRSALYNSGHLAAEDEAAMEALFLRIMTGFIGSDLHRMSEGDAAVMLRYLRLANDMRQGKV